MQATSAAQAGETKAAALDFFGELLQDCGPLQTASQAAFAHQQERFPPAQRAAPYLEERSSIVTLSSSQVGMLLDSFSGGGAIPPPAAASAAAFAAAAAAAAASAPPPPAAIAAFAAASAATAAWRTVLPSVAEVLRVDEMYAA